MNRIERWLNRAAIAVAAVGGFGVFCLMMVTLVAVIWRYGFNDPIFGIGDMSVVILSIVAAASVVFGARNESHVSVNVIDFLFGRKVTRFTDLIMRILAVGISGTASYALFKKACGFEKACITENLSIEHWPFYYVLGFAFAFYCLHLLVQLFTGLVHFNAEVDPNDLADQ